MEQYNNCNRNSCGRCRAVPNSNMYYTGIQNVGRNMSDVYSTKCGKPIGMAYVPSQEFDEIYDAKKGLCEGTMFPELNLVFCGVRGIR